MNDSYQESNARMSEQPATEHKTKYTDAVTSAYPAPPAIRMPGHPGRRLAESHAGVRSVTLAVALAIVSGASALPALALTHGRVDTFSSGSTEGWVSPAANPHPPLVVASGGPAGAGDGYVFVTGMAGPPRSELAALNVTQWAGDYLQAGVSELQMDCWNAGNFALVLRIQISRFSPLGKPTDVVVSKPIVLPPGRGWVPVVVSIALNDMRTLLGDARMALSGACEVQIVQGEARVLHAEDDACPPDFVIGALGVDNFRANGSPTAPTRVTSWARVKSVYR